MTGQQLPRGKFFHGDGGHIGDFVRARLEAGTLSLLIHSLGPSKSHGQVPNQRQGNDSASNEVVARVWRQGGARNSG